MSEFRRRKNETTKERKVSSFDKLKDPKIIRWVIGGIALIAVLIPLLTLVWYSNNQNENVTNPWKMANWLKVRKDYHQIVNHLKLVRHLCLISS